jgi:uncharacterized Tic20 family protein
MRSGPLFHARKGKVRVMATKDAPNDDADGEARTDSDKKSTTAGKAAASDRSVGDASSKADEKADRVPASIDASPHQQLAPEEDTLWAALSHLGGVVGFLPSLIIFLVFRHRGTKTAMESKEALNWQITFTVGWIIIELLVTIVASVVIGAATGLGGHPGGLLAYILSFVPVAIWIVNIVLSVIGFIRVNGGGSYRYPFAVRLIK